MTPALALLLVLAAGGVPPPADADFARQWYLHNDGSYAGFVDVDVDALEAWEVARGAGVLVAVLDTGTDPNHPQLGANIYVNTVEGAGSTGFDDDSNGLTDDINGWDFACNDNTPTDGATACHGANPHGTDMAGLIGAVLDADLTIGLAHQARILPLKVFHLDPAQNDANLDTWAAAAVDYAVAQGAEVIVCPWAFRFAVFPQTLYDSMAAALSAGVVIVAAAGDDGADLTTNPAYPAAFDLPELLTVGASNTRGETVSLPGLSVSATPVDLTAPGETLVTISGTPSRGTGGAAALVAGAAALMKSAESTLTPSQVFAILAGAPLNAANAVRAAEGAGVPPAVFVQAPRRATEGQAALLTAGASDLDNDLAGIEWDFGDGHQAIGTSVHHAFPGGGQWAVATEAVDASGRRGDAHTIVEVPFRWHEQPIAFDAATCPDTGTPGEKRCDFTLPITEHALWVRVHFATLEVSEPDRDWILLDENGNGLFSMRAPGWSEPIPGRAARLFFEGQIGGAFGATIDRYAYQLPGESNHPPVAVVSGSRAVPVGAPATLSAEDSFDPDNDPLIYIWSLLEAPPESIATLSLSPNAAEATLKPDRPGAYTLQLTATDGELSARRLAYIVTLDNPAAPSCTCTLSDLNRNGRKSARRDGAAPSGPGAPWSVGWVVLALLVVAAWRQRYRGTEPTAGARQRSVPDSLCGKRQWRPHPSVMGAVLALVVGGAGCGVHRHAPGSPAGELIHHTVTTRDGWDLAVQRVPSREVRHRTPVLLVHGLMSNHYSLDATAESSMARFLSARGWDVWMVDLRGHGDSERPRLFRKKGNWAFDAYVDIDAPAVIGFIRERTGADDLFWVGHSRGGLIGHAYLGTGGEGVRGFVAIAAPMQFEPTTKMAGLAHRLRLFRRTGISGHVYARLTPLTRGRSPKALWFVWNADNITREERAALGRWALDDLYPAELRHMSEWLAEQRFASVGGAVDYRSSLRNIRVPVFLLAGAVDRIAAPERVVAAYEKLETEDKLLRVFSRANGYDRDYGHVDLICGAQAAREVFPAIDAWLAAHDQTD